MSDPSFERLSKLIVRIRSLKGDHSAEGQRERQKAIQELGDLWPLVAKLLAEVASK